MIRLMNILLTMNVSKHVVASQYTDEEYYLLSFLSHLKDEIVDVVILYSPTTHI
jgi:hypothetical protein